MQSIISNFESLSEDDLTKYAGKWIAIIEGDVVAHSDFFEEVYQTVKADFPKKRPLIGKLPMAIPLVL